MALLCSGPQRWCPDYGALMSRRIIAFGPDCPAVLVDCTTAKGYQPAVSATLSVSFISALAGELIGRGVFYGLHMTVGWLSQVNQ